MKIKTSKLERDQLDERTRLAVFFCDECFSRKIKVGTDLTFSGVFRELFPPRAVAKNVEYVSYLEHSVPTSSSK